MIELLVRQVSVEGIRFNAQRNEEALLNLWAAPPVGSCCWSFAWQAPLG